ncbi:MAG: anaerobic ribonucleoside-triphosphate reductase activating protein [Candidatus Omnitrophota bacterium]
MRIAGLQNLSLVDYPGHVAATVFVQGCNFRCGYCQNPDLIELKEDTLYTEEEVLKYIVEHKNMLEGLVITGGEPCIYQDLPEFVERVKEKDFQVKLDTNGSNPAQLEYMFREKTLDYIAVDVKTSLDKYSLLTDIKNIEEIISETIYLTMLSTIPYEFRITCAPGIVDEEAIRSIGELIKGAEKCCLQQFRPNIVYDENFQGLTPYSKDKLAEFQNILLETVKTVEIRGI